MSRTVKPEGLSTMAAATDDMGCAESTVVAAADASSDVHRLRLLGEKLRAATILLRAQQQTKWTSYGRCNSKIMRAGT